jgi:hypothetical protein
MTCSVSDTAKLIIEPITAVFVTRTLAALAQSTHSRLVFATRFVLGSRLIQGAWLVFASTIDAAFAATLTFFATCIASATPFAATSIDDPKADSISIVCRGRPTSLIAIAVAVAITVTDMNYFIFTQGVFNNGIVAATGTRDAIIVAIG